MFNGNKDDPLYTEISGTLLHEHITVYILHYHPNYYEPYWEIQDTRWGWGCRQVGVVLLYDHSGEHSLDPQLFLMRTLGVSIESLIKSVWISSISLR